MSRYVNDDGSHLEHRVDPGASPVAHLRPLDWEWRITENLQLSGTSCLPDGSFPPIGEILEHIRQDLYAHILLPEPHVVEVRQVTPDESARWHRLDCAGLTVEQNQHININNGLQILEAEISDGAALNEEQRRRLYEVLVRGGSR